MYNSPQSVGSHFVVYLLRLRLQSGNVRANVILFTSIFIAHNLQIIRVNNGQLPRYLFLYGIREWSIKNLNVRYEKI